MAERTLGCIQRFCKTPCYVAGQQHTPSEEAFCNGLTGLVLEEPPLPGGLKALATCSSSVSSDGIILNNNRHD